MKLIGFSFFLLLVQTFRGIEGDVQCGDNNTVPNCRICLFTTPPAPLGIDPQNCNTSLDCMLNDDSSDCVRRPTEAAALPVDAEDSNTNPSSSSEANLAPSAPDHTGQELLVSSTEDILSKIKVGLRRNVEGRIRQYGVQVEVCNGENCCRTDTVFGRGGILTFVSAFNNLGNCGQLRRSQDLSVTVLKSGREYYLLDPLFVTIIFDDGSIFKKQDVIRCGRWSSLWCEPTFIPLHWGRTYRDMQQTGSRVIPTQAVPAAQCPEVVNPNANACPRANVRVHRQKQQQERKSCYYQVCETVSTDLSRLGDGEDGLGTGGYCAPTAQPQDQYIFCCDLESYFTHPNKTAAGDFRPKNPEDIKFPECSQMINDHPTP
jgi:hypothetical protein